MRKVRAIKVAICAASAALFLSIPVYKAEAANIIHPEQGIVGMAFILDRVSENKLENNSEFDISSMLKKEVLSPYENLGVSIADSYVNIRKEPSTESEVVGKLYRGCATNILERLDGDWVKIESGNVEGYIASNFLAIGKDAEAMIDQYATKYATVTADALRVRKEQSTDSRILTQIPQGETYIITNEYDEWVEILLGTDDETGKDFTGYLFKQFIDITVEFEYAISVEEENARIRAEQESIRAEQERLEAEEAAKKAEQQRKAEEAAKKAEQQRKAEEAARIAEAKRAAEAQRSQEQGSSSNDNTDSDEEADNSTVVPDTSENTSNEKPESNSSSNSGLDSKRQEVITYALKFVGNRYVFGGTSLTNGTDCSGFTQAIYASFGYKIGRSSRDQIHNGERVAIGERKPGDLLFYTNSSGTINHVAMYIGNDKIVHAANSRQGIITSKYNYRNVYAVRRIIK